MQKAELQDILDGHKHLGAVNLSRVMDGLILLSAVAIALETMPSLPLGFRLVLYYFEVALLFIFLIEYGLRLYAAKKPLRYIFSWWGIVDLLSFAPALLFLTPHWQVLRAFKLLRLIRLMKLFRGSHAMQRLVIAFQSVRSELMVFGIIAALMLYVSAVGIYIFEHEAQPDIFISIPHSLWWAVASFTTVGYGDMYPITAGGRIFTSFLLFLGLGVIAVPSAIVTTALLEAETNIERRLHNDEETKIKESKQTAHTTKGD
jgi:voltage-gated potassium channel